MHQGACNDEFLLFSIRQDANFIERGLPMSEREEKRQLLLDHQIAIITGAAKGIGRGIAVEMAREGASVVLADVDEEGMNETEKMIGLTGQICLKAHMDIQDIEQGHQLVNATLQQFGKIDILVNNAGINTPGPTQILEISTDAYDRVFHTNLRGPFFLTQHVVKE